MKKKLFALLASILLLLCGCSADVETETCFHCGDQVDRWIEYGDSDVICARCFQDGGFRICLGCGFPYDPYYTDDIDGYCESCAEEHTWFCTYCEERKSLDDLVQVDDGYYMCGSCLYWVAKPFDNAFSEIYADYVSPFDLADTSLSKSRNDALGIDGDWEEDTSSSVFSEPEYYFLDYEDGYSDGYSEGYAAGQIAGYEEGFQKGKDSGKYAAYNDGYTSGYSAGKADAAKTTSSSYLATYTGGSSGSGSSQSVERTVYITNTGSKYHRSGCQHLRKSCISISLSDAKDRGYSPCSKCW